jgi:hypothetical protein
MRVKSELTRAAASATQLISTHLICAVLLRSRKYAQQVQRELESYSLGTNAMPVLGDMLVEAGELHVAVASVCVVPEEAH